MRVIDNDLANANGATDIEAVDLDGDGDTDVVTAARYLRSVRLVRERRVDAPRLDPARHRQRHRPTPTKHSDIEAVDFDGDGDIDVVTAASTSDQFAWYENDGSTPPGWTLHVIDSGTTNADGARTSKRWTSTATATPTW